MAASCSSTSASVEGPVLVFLRTGSCCFSNRTVASWRGELRLRSTPATREISPSSRAEVGAQLLAEPGEERAVDRDPLPLHVHQHLHQRHLDVAEQRLHLHLAERGREELVQREHGGAVGAAVARPPPRPATSANGISAFPFPATSW